MERNSETFRYNLKASQSKEIALSISLQHMGYNTTTTQDMGSFKGYDVKCWIGSNTGKTTTYEVKLDKLAHTTGNIAVELWKVIDGQKVLSGLSATSSDYYVYTFPELPGEFFIISTEILKQMCRDKQYSRLVWGGNGGYFRNALFNKEKFLSKCSIIKAFAGE